MARQRTAVASPAVTPERAARLCRLLRLVSNRKQPRATLLARLQLDMRGFYRDLKLLRDVGINVALREGKYVLDDQDETVMLRLPCPDPHLTLGEAIKLSKGRSAIHRKIKDLLESILPKGSLKR